MDALVSVCVCTYNQQETLRETLQHLLEQQGDFELEIVVGEDCSTDSTRTILLETAQRYPQIKPILQTENQGLLRNFHAVLQACTGDYITLCAGDDFWHDHQKLSKQIDYLESHPQCGLVYTSVIRWHVDEPGQPRETYVPRALPKGREFQTLMRQNPIPAISVCFRSTLLQYIDMETFDREGFRIEDYPMWLEFSRHTRFHYLPHATATYRITGQSISHSNQYEKSISYQKAIFQIRRYYQQKYSDSGLTLRKIDTQCYKRLCYIALRFKNIAEASRFIRQIPHFPTRLLCRFRVITKLGKYFG